MDDICYVAISKVSRVIRNSVYIPIMALGRIASKSFKKVRAYPRYAFGEYMHSVEK
jgi:hypothetical protein